jgi:hypothetical protein
MLNPEIGSNVPFLGSQFIVLRSNFWVFPLTQDHCSFSRRKGREMKIAPLTRRGNQIARRFPTLTRGAS